mmetsp:Transcript_19053/g.49177  ORF Transcript_19053/g.49177 Transcript_19053/m.49177 type:complete len:264 (-) Transcript_19053:168-959(-)
MSLAGLAAGVAQVLAEHPLDTLKVRLQTRARVDLRTALDWRGVLVSTVRGEGMSALYLGIWPRILTYGAVKASLFALYETFRGGDLAPASAGALAGACNALPSCPPEVVKSRCQVSMHGAQGDGWHFVRTSHELVTKHGMRALFRGLPTLALRDTVGYSCLFTAFDAGERGGLPRWLAGGLAGCSFYAATMPIDRVKTVLMTQSFACPAYASGWHAAWDIIVREGVLGLYRGTVPALLRTFVGQAVGLTVYSAMARPATGGRR